MPASQASRTVAIASSRVVGPQTCPIPPPPRVRALISPSVPKVRCCMGSSLNQSQVRGEGADTHCLSGRWSIREGGPKVLICYASKRAAGRQGRAGPHCSRTVLRAGCLLIPPTGSNSPQVVYLQTCLPCPFWRKANNFEGLDHG